MAQAYVAGSIATVMTITGVGVAVIVTFSREYGALGRSVTRGVAQRLGYELVDEALAPERPSGFGERFLRSLGAAALPEAFDPAVTVEDLSASAVQENERLIVEAADRGNVVIVGRGANALLAGRRDLVRVFLRAPVAWRTHHIAESLGLDRATAQAELARVDAARRAFARERHAVEWGDPRFYDMLIDSSVFGAEGTAAVIVCAVRERAS